MVFVDMCCHVIYFLYALSCSFWSIMDYSKQATHFELGKLGEGEAAGKIEEDDISL